MSIKEKISQLVTEEHTHVLPGFSIEKMKKFYEERDATILKHRELLQKLNKLGILDRIMEMTNGSEIELIRTTLEEKKEQDNNWKENFLKAVQNTGKLWDLIT